MTSSFAYVNDDLWCEGVALAELAAAAGTPLYVYSAAEIRARAQVFARAVGHAHFAVKANGNLAILRLLAEQGLGADVTSGGELFLTLRAGFDPQSIIFSGVGKTAAEIEMALDSSIQALHVESEAELGLIEALAAARGEVAAVGVRLNPNINAATHPYISTGLTAHKFGVAMAQGIELIYRAHQSPHLRLTGIAAHIGSQIKDLAPFQEAAALLADTAAELRSSGIALDYVDVGGGLGIDYTGEGSPPVEAWIAAVSEPILAAGFALVMEPGRSIVGAAGILLTQVVRTKRQGEKEFVITDAGMSDLIRPTLYSAHHDIKLIHERQHLNTVTYDIVGPICESGDFFAKGRSLPAVAAGDLLAVMDAGAYGFAMSSNYNGRPRPAEVLVEGEKWRIIRPRQSYADLLSE